MKSFAILLATLVSISFPARGEYAVGYFYLKNNQPTRAYQEFRKLANVGYPFYMNIVADMHWTGTGIARNPVLAHVWYSLSAAQDNKEGIAMRLKIGGTLSQDERNESIKLTREYARLYLEPFVAEWSLDKLSSPTIK